MPYLLEYKLPNHFQSACSFKHAVSDWIISNGNRTE